MKKLKCMILAVLLTVVGIGGLAILLVTIVNFIVSTFKWLVALLVLSSPIVAIVYVTYHTYCWLMDRN